MALKTATEYKTATGSTVSDANVTSALAAAQRRIERYIGSDGLDYSASITEYQDGLGGQSLQARRWPITEITSIAYRAGDAGDDWQVFNSDTYTYDQVTDNVGTIHRIPMTHARVFAVDEYGVPYRTAVGQRGVFFQGFKNIRLIYAAGYDDGTSGVDVDTYAPDLVEALYGVTDSILSARGRDPAIQSKTLGSFGYTLRASEESSKEIREMLRPFRRGDLW